MKDETGGYIGALRDRAAKARVTRPFQLIGLEIATALKDLEHKALYIKMAKEYGADQLLSIAKDIGQNKKVSNKGGYFMRVIQGLKKN